jgi:hypothetical protein
MHPLFLLYDTPIYVDNVGGVGYFCLCSSERVSTKSYFTV